MPEKTMRDAINEALHQAMEQDESVFVIGEDVAGCSGSAGDVGAVGGVFGVTGGSITAGPIAALIRQSLSPPSSAPQPAPHWSACDPWPRSCSPTSSESVWTRS